MSQESMNPQLDPKWHEVVGALGQLRPAASLIDRDQFFFLAGQAAAESTSASGSRPKRWLWPLATVAAAIVSAVVTLSLDRTLQPGAPIVAAGITAPPPESAIVGSRTQIGPAFNAT